jgi:hypothetical protein
MKIDDVSAIANGNGFSICIHISTTDTSISVTPQQVQDVVDSINAELSKTADRLAQTAIDSIKLLDADRKAEVLGQV